ncbi:hypothetical protein GCM10012275_01230 [Longimycelium tulufanense]|uniref:Uncharacterized protein n=2 Tax=Longimycelium tulufanense TaxID=907463 RepID=A0A8J3C9T1_9PSEU|nr:hypothetical protein GCM10012275_01230 [Longimycelium tulufanense]
MSAPEWAYYIAVRLGSPGQARSVRDECVGYVVAAIRNGQGPLLNGARDLIVKVAEQVQIALASSAARSVIDTVLSLHQIEDRFSATVSSEEVRRGKPNPDVYQEAARRIGIAAGTGIAVEDSGNGIRAAHAAGLSVVAIPNPTYPPAQEALELADHVAADHHDALDYVLDRLAKETRR